MPIWLLNALAFIAPLARLAMLISERICFSAFSHSLRAGARTEEPHSPSSERHRREHTKVSRIRHACISLSWQPSINGEEAPEGVTDLRKRSGRWPGIGWRYHI